MVGGPRENVKRVYRYINRRLNIEKIRSPVKTNKRNFSQLTELPLVFLEVTG